MLINQKIKKNIRFLKRLVNIFGFLNGSSMFLRLLFNKTILVRPEGIKHKICLRSRTSDIQTFIKVFGQKEYAIEKLNSHGIIIDGGANIGLFTIFMKNIYPEAKVICIEPDPGNFMMLQKNLAAYKNVFFEQAGLWNKTINLNISERLGVENDAFRLNESEPNGEVRSITVNEILKKYSIKKIDILKLDIETSEKYLFSSNYEGWLPRVKRIIIELHDKDEEGCSKAFFTAVNHAYTKYSYSVKGENTIIQNLNADNFPS